MDTKLKDDVILHEDDLSSEAKDLFRFHEEIFQASKLNRRSILDNNQMNCIGRHLSLSLLEQSHMNSKQVLNYMADNHQSIHEELPSIRPLMICGLPRTGSTLLYNLLACDPNCRAPSSVEMCIQSVPPISPSNTIENERRKLKGKLIAQGINLLLKRPNAVAASHPTFDIEEDMHILYEAGVLVPTAILGPEDNSEFIRWFYDDKNKDFAYDYHQTVLRMLNSVGKPRSHWLLKAPNHTLFLDTFVRHYPQALIIMCHRNLDEVIPSFYKLIMAHAEMYFDDDNVEARAKTLEKSLLYIDTSIKRLMEFCSHGHHSRNKIAEVVFDVIYDDLMRDPIGTIHKIYDYFNLQWSNEFEQNMKKWLDENPQGKQGRNTYSLQEFNLNANDIEKRFGDYIKLYLRPSSAN